MYLKEELKRSKTRMTVYETDVTYEPKANEEYDIIGADEITTRNGLQGLRVELVAKNKLDARAYGITLWPSSQASSTSKWGAFISVLGNDTVVWIGQRIRILSMESRKCAIEIVKSTSAKSKKGVS
jgi:hypothetical protein